MPVHNGEKYLRPAMESILGQTFTDFEFIIINDGSTDSTESIINSYEDDRIVLIKNKEKIGVSKSLNKAVEISKGEYIARMDADDISLPGRLEKQLIFLENHEEIGVLGSNACLINSEGKEIGKYIRPESPQLIKWTALFSNPMIHPSIMARAHILKENKYDESFKNGQDYELWSRLIFTKNISFTNLNEPLIRYRIHGSSVTKKIESENKIPISVLVARDHIDYLGIDRNEEKEYLMLLGSPKNTIKNIFKAIKQLRFLMFLYFKKEKLNQRETWEIKKDNYKRYLSMIENYFKHKIKEIFSKSRE